MTNTEIIEGLKAVRTIHNGNYAPQIDEAIKKLSVEPPEDCISRQAALDKAIWVDNGFGYEFKAVEIEEIQALPSIRPKTERSEEVTEGATNGEMIKAMFPNEVECGESASFIYYGTMRFDRDWWNSPYRKDGNND